MKWRKLKEFDNFEISSDGRLRKNGRLVKLGKTMDGYQQYAFRINGKAKYKRIHALVLETFIGPRPPKHDCCHINGIPNDNRIENLRWCTRKENVQDSIKHGTKAACQRHGSAKLTNDQVKKIRQEYADGMTGYALAKKYNLARSAMHNIVIGRAWKTLDKELSRTDKK